MKKSMKLFVVTIFLFHSCSEHTNEVTVESTETGKNKETRMSDSQDFPEFWVNFRSAIVNSNTLDLIGQMQKPLEFKGYEDIDPFVKIYSKDSILDFFDKFLDENNVSYQDLATHREFLQKVSKIEEYDTTSVVDGTKRIENMLFTKTEKGWKLGRVYMNTKEIKK